MLRVYSKRVQKKSHLYDCEPDEDFPFYVVFDEGLTLSIANPVSAKCSPNDTSSVKKRSPSKVQFLRHTHAEFKNFG